MSAAHVQKAGGVWFGNRNPVGSECHHNTYGIRAAVPGNGGGALWQSDARSDGFLCPTGFAIENQGALPHRGQRASGSRRADGGVVGADSSPQSYGRFDFAAPVPPGGYRWWYVDALSDDGAYGLSIIGFIGSVFSPYYTLARHRAAKAGTASDPTNHCSINVALYGKGCTRWAMTERGREQLHASADSLTIGPSAMVWDGTSLTISFDEVAVPLPRRIKGTLKLFPNALTSQMYTLNPDGQHCWWPIAPVSRVEVALEYPALKWSGNAYFDHNRGDAPIADGFRTWTWSRAPLSNGAVVLYDGLRKDGSPFLLGLHFDEKGGVTPIKPPPLSALPRSNWLIPRSTRSEAGIPAKVLDTLEDTPFYARSVVAARMLGEDVTAVHESMSVDRFDTTLVQLMLPFRMPRRA
jgi:carotenoid 1,2-hydratase